MTAILGISCYFHDAAAAVVVDGVVVAAAQQERFSRIKGDASFPVDAIDFVLAASQKSVNAIDQVAFYEHQTLKLDRVVDEILQGHMPSRRESAKRLRRWFSYGTNDERLRGDLELVGLHNVPIMNFRHHESHAAAAFLASPFETAAILCVDAVGEYAVSSGWHGASGKLTPLFEDRLPNSLGLFYSALTSYCGFAVNEGEYKVMGLAPYGQPRFVQQLKNEVVEVRDNGEVVINRNYINPIGDSLVSPNLELLLGSERRKSSEEVDQYWADVAKSTQVIFEEAFVSLAAEVKRLSGDDNLALAGGSALNGVAVGKLEQGAMFERIWTQPAAGDAGSAVGAALLAWTSLFGELPPSRSDRMSGAFLGPSFSDDQIKTVLEKYELFYDEYCEDGMIRQAVDDLADGKIIGWFHGAMEFGPRALGSRSILADPRDPAMTQRINLAIKYREAFRPIAPAVLEEAAEHYFEMNQPSPYMTRVCRVREEHIVNQAIDHSELQQLTLPQRLSIPRSTIPSITHVDGTARPQTVSKSTSPLFHRLISAFNERTGMPMVCNTSMNRRDEPIALTPDDAVAVFLGTELDCLSIGSFYVRKNRD